MRALLVNRDASDLMLLFDRYVIIPFACVIVIILALRYFRRKPHFISGSCVMFAAAVGSFCIYYWFISRHDYLIVAQNYNRQHKYTCDPNAEISDQPSRHFVVSKYKEGTAWLRCPEYANVTWTIYDKYDKMSSNYLENLGYECSPYLTFILDSYDSLPDITYFIHANPFEHCPRFTTALHGADVRPFVFLSSEYQGFQTDGQPQHPPRHGFAPVFQRVWNELGLPLPIPARGGVYLNGQFAVHRERILQRPREFYEKALWLVTDGRDRDAYSWGRRGDGWLECVVMERIWSVMFGEPSIDVVPYSSVEMPLC